MEHLNKITRWGLSILCFIAIMWLTLAPHPLGDTDIPLFPGADKLAHFLMFGGFAFCIIFDWERYHEWAPCPRIIMMRAADIPCAVAILTEVLQLTMGLGRAFELLDIIADITGAYVCAIVTYLIFNRGRWL